MMDISPPRGWDYLPSRLSMRPWIESVAPRPQIIPRAKPIKKFQGLPRSGEPIRKERITPMLPIAARREPIPIFFLDFIKKVDLQLKKCLVFMYCFIFFYVFQSLSFHFKRISYCACSCTCQYKRDTIREKV